jgi:hypothetical protein
VVQDEQFPEGHLVRCRNCDRPILVEIVLFAVSHNARVAVICWECLDQESQLRAAARYGLGGDQLE